jgi:hypothetical protein
LRVQDSTSCHRKETAPDLAPYHQFLAEWKDRKVLSNSLRYTALLPSHFSFCSVWRRSVETSKFLSLKDRLVLKREEECVVRIKEF